MYSVSSMMYLAKKMFHLTPSRLQNSQFIRNVGKERKNPTGYRGIPGVQKVGQWVFSPKNAGVRSEEGRGRLSRLKQT